MSAALFEVFRLCIVAHPLDDPVRSSLTGPHAQLAKRRGGILSYPTRANQYLGLPDPPGAEDWADVAALVQAEQSVFACFRLHRRVEFDSARLTG